MNLERLENNDLDETPEAQASISAPPPSDVNYERERPRRGPSNDAHIMLIFHKLISASESPALSHLHS